MCVFFTVQQLSVCVAVYPPWSDCGYTYVFFFSSREGTGETHLEGLQRAFAVSTTRFNILTAPVQVLLRRQSFSTEMRTILRQERRALVRALGGGERGEGASRLWDCVREGVLDSLFPAYIQNHVRKPGKPGHRKHRG